MKSLAESGAALLGGELRQSCPLEGGSLSQIVQIALQDGREAIVKGGPAPRAEAAMLYAIAASGAPAPAVLAVSTEALVIELMPAGGSLNRAWVSLGEAAATLHAAKGRSYGWAENYAFGPVAIVNDREDRWRDFWAAHRLLTHCAHISAPLARRVEMLAADLANRLPAQPTPALLHGDLWGGNVLVAGDNKLSALIDPACYYGHAEVDIAMLSLFDTPSSAFYEAYGGMEPGHEERLVIYQLWPALVHLRLFGNSYRPLVERFLSCAGV
ncbi:MAG: fructosamine kinase family protein [Rhodomicrobium sp.]